MASGPQMHAMAAPIPAAGSMSCHIWVSGRINSVHHSVEAIINAIPPPISIDGRTLSTSHPARGARIPLTIAVGAWVNAAFVGEKPSASCV
ncbi:Uncharacterised protein [Mycobacteroides abscessus subsp. abscessus]|nr:Uncharacterised protein [Mycobacteroides abscessus subsp. abscessus]